MTRMKLDANRPESDQEHDGECDFDDDQCRSDVVTARTGRLCPLAAAQAAGETDPRNLKRRQSAHQDTDQESGRSRDRQCARVDGN